MRVISGTAKGRPLKAVPGTGTRPTTDKVKEAVFSMIGPYFDGGRALDLFAGTGGLGIEALSRGMEQAVFVDKDSKSIEVIRENLKTAKVEGKAEVYRNEAVRALKALAKREVRFDLVFLDPPYRMKDMDALMLLMKEQRLLNDGATVMIEHDSSHTYPEEAGSFHTVKHSVYGETAITVYRYNEEDGDNEELTQDEEDQA
ncbi:16S rRNA (guanine(966)-N(2))-methyltransferase RsmD [Paenibacillus aurantius]|uniref:16S rRNA (Guanine(966)-N(2))-methyltransferase RsmD n=1 Tax=Paenibacillus aurantius TaxID=2918900 RepID=A0AA96LGV1_9BACL|nr:16S rRNA (guanine(966)-N(2))-methyltransferase RsmD [Paenibacillus aurantius]WNQ13687.1 16S rRNA (guanine(966)-N(2))-methyltransferase RsmD [Paenibacillus aurantius]